MAGAPAQAETKQALLAYLDALMLAEPLQTRLWQEAEITLTQLTVLRELRNGPQTAGRLGQAAGISPASLTRLVERLERRGLVTRHRESDDRRCVEVRLEPAGERLIGQIRVLHGSDLQQAIDSMTGVERTALTGALRRLVQLTRGIAAAKEGAE